MVSRQDVEYAYRLFLGREPENKTVVTNLADTTSSLQDLRAKFFASAEFQAYLTVHAGLMGVGPSPKPLNWGKSHVDVLVSPRELARMVRHVEATWEELGRLEPHWSVLTNEKYRAATIGENEQAFFESGKIASEAMRASAARYGISIENYKDCFELGCGVGRVTIWLAGLFSHVIGSDISAPHIEIAKETMTERDCQNVELLKLGSLADLENLPAFDAFFSVIVLQHNPPPVIAHILGTILKKLRPNGIGYFQVPTYSLGYSFVASKYLDKLVHTGIIEMHVLPQDALFALIEQCDCELLEIREDPWTGAPTIVSNSVLVRKR